ncbi:unnamed protein product [Protopolystoma xenopodis]|uniref:Uncharacterized protein n=1 Tax=Protopolystoma xenopodis TaxID=117903 RepID=A0A3S5CSQ9_9PLAT|nr:unnamed protein product [Protopolystoma xenopodis]
MGIYSLPFMEHTPKDHFCLIGILLILNTISSEHYRRFRSIVTDDLTLYQQIVMTWPYKLSSPTLSRSNKQDLYVHPLYVCSGLVIRPSGRFVVAPHNGGNILFWLLHARARLRCPDDWLPSPDDYHIRVEQWFAPSPLHSGGVGIASNVDDAPIPGAVTPDEVTWLNCSHLRGKDAVVEFSGRLRRLRFVWSISAGLEMNSSRGLDASYGRPVAVNALPDQSMLPYGMALPTLRSEASNLNQENDQDSTRLEPGWARSGVGLEARVTSRILFEGNFTSLESKSNAFSHNFSYFHKRISIYFIYLYLYSGVYHDLFSGIPNAILSLKASQDMPFFSELILVIFYTAKCCNIVLKLINTVLKASYKRESIHNWFIIRHQERLYFIK